MPRRLEKPVLDVLDQCCENCMFWTSHTSTSGECHRRAPHPTLENVNEDIPDRTAFWPETLVGDWCGEWGHPAVQQKGSNDAS